MKKEDFKPHMMYDKDGKAYKANTYEQHVKMKGKGYGHTPKKKKGKKKTAKKQDNMSYAEAVEKRMSASKKKGRY